MRYENSKLPPAPGGGFLGPFRARPPESLRKLISSHTLKPSGAKILIRFTLLEKWDGGRGALWWEDSVVYFVCGSTNKA